MDHLSISSQTVTILTSPVLIPWVASTLTHARAPKWVVSVVQIVLAAVVGLVSTSVDPSGVAVLSQTAVLNTAWAAALSIGSYFGVWRYLGLIRKIWPGAPIGKPGETFVWPPVAIVPGAGEPLPPPPAGPGADVTERGRSHTEQSLSADELGAAIVALLRKAGLR